MLGKLELDNREQLAAWRLGAPARARAPRDTRGRSNPWGARCCGRARRWVARPRWAVVLIVLSTLNGGEQQLLSGSVDPAVQISVGQSQACAVRESGALTCWGFGPEREGPPGSYRSVSVSYEHACAVRESGEVVCWRYDYLVGEDYFGAADAPAGSYRSVSAGANHSCAVRESGEIACWGSGALDAPPGRYRAGECWRQPQLCSAGVGRDCLLGEEQRRRTGCTPGAVPLGECGRQVRLLAAGVGRSGVLGKERPGAGGCALGDVPFAERRVRLRMRRTSVRRDRLLGE